MHTIKILIFYYHTEVHKTKFSIKNILTEQRENRLPKKYDQAWLYFSQDVHYQKQLQQVNDSVRQKYTSTRQASQFIGVWHYACYDKTGISLYPKQGH